MRSLITVILLTILQISSANIALADPPKLNHGLPYVRKDIIIISDYLASEKLDGVRAYWDGSQLLSKSGNKIHCPKWFSETLPNIKLDGELWIERNNFEQVVSIVRKNIPKEEEWRKIKYMLFELPGAKGTFENRYERIKTIVAQTNLPYLQVIKQQRLQNVEELDTMLETIIEKGGEGVMLHLASSKYRPGRTNHILKVKKYYDDEAEILDHIAGKGKYEGMLGSVLVRNSKGKVFKIGTGFSDNDRRHPPAIGATITYKYYGETANNIPRFASFLRVREDL